MAAGGQPLSRGYTRQALAQSPEKYRFRVQPVKSAERPFVTFSPVNRHKFGMFCMAKESPSLSSMHSLSPTRSQARIDQVAPVPQFQTQYDGTASNALAGCRPR